MKHTIKLDGGKSLVIEPGKASVNLSIRVGQVPVGSMAFRADTLGAVMFALEEAARQSGMAGAPAAVIL